MKFVKIKISELKPDKEQPRKSYGGLKELGQSLQLKGQLTPIVITSSNEIIDGHRRYFSAKKLGMEYLDAVIINGKRKLTPFLKRAFPFAINVERENFNAWEMAESINDIYWNYFLEEYEPKRRDDSGYSEFARFMGLSPSTVYSILRVYKDAKKSKPLQKALKEKNITYNDILEISKSPRESHAYLIDMVKKEKDKPLKNKSHVRDKLRDERAKEQLRQKEDLPFSYVTRIKSKSKSLKSLLNESVIEKATSQQLLEIKKTIKPFITFYKKL